MATDFSTNTVVLQGGVRPSTTNTPLDIRTRIETIDDVPSIPVPYVGMIFYVKDTGKRYEVLTLKDKKVGILTTKDALVDEYRELPYAYTDAVNAQIEELQRQIDLKANSGDVLSREEIEELIRQNAGGSGGDCAFTNDMKNAIENELINRASFDGSSIKFFSRSDNEVSSVDLNIMDSTDVSAILDLIKQG